MIATEKIAGKTAAGEEILESRTNDHVHVHKSEH